MRATAFPTLRTLYPARARHSSQEAGATSGRSSPRIGALRRTRCSARRAGTRSVAAVVLVDCGRASKVTRGAILGFFLELAPPPFQYFAS